MSSIISIASSIINNPKESLVLINDDKIIYHAVGATYEVGFDDKNLFSLLDPIMLHPISYGDFVNLNSHEAERSIYAINSLGE